MHRINRRSVILTALSTLVGAAVAQQGGQAVRIVVPFAAGSAPDIVARTIADPLAGEFGAPVTIENLPGAGGMLGVTHVANAAPDGRTVVMSGDAALVMPDPNRVRRYDPQRDFQPESIAGRRRRPRRLSLCQRRNLDAAGSRRSSAYIRSVIVATHVHRARTADASRIRAAGLRGDGLVRDARARGHAAGDAGALAACGPDCARNACGQSQAAVSGHRGGGRIARRTP